VNDAPIFILLLNIHISLLLLKWYPSHFSFLFKLILKLDRQFLHAKTLGFAHPVSGKEIEFSSFLPQELDNILKTLRKLNK